MTTASNQKLADLVQALYDRTRSSVIHWESTSVNNVYACRLGNYIVHIGESGTSSRTDVVVKIFNESGNLVDEFTDVTLSDCESPTHDGYFSLMMDLLSLASRQASGADEAVDELLRILK